MVGVDYVIVGWRGECGRCVWWRAYCCSVLSARMWPAALGYENLSAEKIVASVRATTMSVGHRTQECQLA